MAELHHKLFIFLSVFWILLIMFSHYVGVELSKTGLEDIYVNDQEAYKEKTGLIGSIINSVINTINDIPVLNFFAPVLKITTFRYATTTSYFLGVIINLLSILTAFVVYVLIRKG